MIQRAIATTLLLLSGALSLWSQEIRDSCAITYVANEGFLVETGTAKVLVDALFGNIQGNWCDQPTDSVRRRMINGIAPFDDVDVLLVTHKHVDHFDAPTVMSFLKSNRKAVLMCPEQVTAMLERSDDYPIVGDRVISIAAKGIVDTPLCVNGVNIRAYRLTHGPYFVIDSVTGKRTNVHVGVQNVAYLIEANGFTVFHSGDNSPSAKEEYKTSGIDRKQIDVALLGTMFLGREGQECLNECVHARNLGFMHVEPGKGDLYRSIIKNVPEMYVFASPMERRIYTKPRKQ